MQRAILMVAQIEGLMLFRLDRESRREQFMAVRAARAQGAAEPGDGAVSARIAHHLLRSLRNPPLSAANSGHSARIVPIVAYTGPVIDKGARMHHDISLITTIAAALGLACCSACSPCACACRPWSAIWPPAS